MLKPQDDLALMEDYHYGRLNLSQQKAFELRLEEDSNFALEWQAYQALFLGFDGLALEALERDMKLWEAEIPEQSPQVLREPSVTYAPLSWWKRPEFRAAAAILVFVSLPLIYFSYQPLSPKTPAGLVLSQDIEHYQALNLQMRRGTEANVLEEEEPQEAIKILEKAIYSYNEYDYAQAIKYFEAYLAYPNVKKTESTLLYLGVSYLAEAHYDEAYRIFRELATKNNHMQAAAQWYLALCLLKKNQLPAAKQLLQEISQDSRHFYQQKAKELLRLMAQHHFD